MTLKLDEASCGALLHDPWPVWVFKLVKGSVFLPFFFSYDLQATRMINKN